MFVNLGGGIGVRDMCTTNYFPSYLQDKINAGKINMYEKERKDGLIIKYPPNYHYKKQRIVYECRK